jgi:hypothetical protein
VRISLTVYRIPLTVTLSTYPWPATVATKARSNLKDSIDAFIPGQFMIEIFRASFFDFEAS